MENHSYSFGEEMVVVLEIVYQLRSFAARIIDIKNINVNIYISIIKYTNQNQINSTEIIISVL